jgi:hypothetical protein
MNVADHAEKILKLAVGQEHKISLFQKLTANTPVFEVNDGRSEETTLCEDPMLAITRMVLAHSPHLKFTVYDEEDGTSVVERVS